MKGICAKHKNICAVFLLLCASFIFWRQLFLPHISLIATPEFSGIESIDFGYATKYFYGNALKNFELPLWAPTIGKGFPMLGEGQTGVFYLPNLFFFFLFSPPIAYNLSIVFCSFLSSLGMYVFLKNFSIHNTIAILLGTVFGNGAYFYLQAAHIPLIAGFSLLPWMLYAIDSYCRHKSYTSLLFFSFLLSQQIFTGALQTVFISCSFVLAYALLFDSKNRFQSLFRISLYTFIGILLSGIQLIPSIEFLSQIPNSGIQSTNEAVQFSFPFKHFLTFIDPFIFGSPKNGSYDWVGASGGSNYWENVGYFGVIPLIFLFLGVLFGKKFQAKKLWILLGISVLLMLGSSSPVYFLFHIWPFSLFRVPSRYIVPFTFFLLTLCALYTNSIVKKTRNPLLRKSIFLLLFANTCIVFSQFSNYHRLIPINQVYSPPKSAQSITATDVYYSYQNHEIWGNEFMKYGWKNEIRIQQFESFLTANRNILYGRKNATFRSGRPLEKNSFVDRTLQELLFYKDSSSAAKLLQIQGINTLVSGYDLPEHDTLRKIATVSSDPKISIYTISDVASNFYVTGYKPKIAKTVEQALFIMNTPEFKPGKDIVLSPQSASNIPRVSSGAYSYAPHVFYKNNRTIIIATKKTQTPGIAVSTNTLYPGWTAKINEEKTTIFPVNINQIGFVVPKEPTHILLEYKPTSFFVGIFISIIGLLTAIGATIFFTRK